MGSFHHWEGVRVARRSLRLEGGRRPPQFILIRSHKTRINRD